MYIGFEFIQPTPASAVSLSPSDLARYGWESKAADVVKFKDSLKADLRVAQLGRCCFCRRLLPSDDIATDLEHFIEKSAHPEFAFEIRNIALSCVLCNTKKNAIYSRLSWFLSNRNPRAGRRTMHIRRCPVLSAPIPVTSDMPTDSARYRWVHPHLDNFSDHIRIGKGWVFSWQTNKGLRTVRGLELNALSKIERRATEERLAGRPGMLALMMGAFAELNTMQKADVCRAVAKELRRRRTVATVIIDA